MCCKCSYCHIKGIVQIFEVGFCWTNNNLESFMVFHKRVQWNGCAHQSDHTPILVIQKSKPTACQVAFVTNIKDILLGTYTYNLYILTYKLSSLLTYSRRIFWDISAQSDFGYSQVLQLAAAATAYIWKKQIKILCQWDVWLRWCI